MGKFGLEFFKFTVSVISSDPPGIVGIVRFTTVTFKASSNQE